MLLGQTFQLYPHSNEKFMCHLQRSVAASTTWDTTIVTFLNMRLPNKVVATQRKCAKIPTERCGTQQEQAEQDARWQLNSEYVQKERAQLITREGTPAPSQCGFCKWNESREQLSIKGFCLWFDKNTIRKVYIMLHGEIHSKFNSTTYYKVPYIRM